MTATTAKTRSLRSLRMRALAPRYLLYLLLGVLCLAGLRAILAPASTVQRTVTVGSTQVDFAAGSFAESFARAYLTWSAGDTGQRAQALSRFLAQSLDGTGGLSPAQDTSESVSSTELAGLGASGPTTLVTVEASTSRGVVYLSVPVTRDSTGRLAVADYPAFVGPPPTNNAITLTAGDPVDDQSLLSVVQRALGNYLTGAGSNLAADMAQGAIASVPPQPLRLQQMGQAQWIAQGSSLAAQVTATDSAGDAWTLTYRVGVAQANGRWYVDSIQVNPTSERGLQ